jgi:hypothetical protein
MNLTVKTQPAQHPAQPVTNPERLLEMAKNHVFAAARITDIENLRYFTMHDLQDVRINLHLAIELLMIVSRKAGASDEC